MIEIISSKAASPNRLLRKVLRPEEEDNVQWLRRNLEASEEHTHVVLVGGTSTASFRLRVAQSHVRHDLVPSYWSHAMLLGRVARNVGATLVHEIALDPPQGFAFPPPTNALQRSRLSLYRDPKLFPNIALLRVAVPQQGTLDALESFQRQRAVLDAVDLVIRWLAYVWGVSRSGNPLLDGYGIPSAAMLEIVFGVVGYDLTPGLESRASCPEAIWQAAKWWHGYYEEQNRVALSGAFHVGHAL
jgi:hypothetical protein